MCASLCIGCSIGNFVGRLPNPSLEPRSYALTSGFSNRVNMRNTSFACLLTLGLSLLSLTAQALNNGADTFYEQGIEALNQLQRLSAEQSADADELGRHLDDFNTNISRAAQLGHPAATLFRRRCA